jgi:hypothetical protein
MQIKFTNEEGCKYFAHDSYQFFANRQGRDGYTLQIYEYYHVPDAHQINRYCSRRVQIPYEPASDLKAIRERIIQFINQNN